LEERLKALEERLADLEREDLEIRSGLERQKELQTDLARKMIGELKELLQRLEMIERKLETWEGP